MQKAQLRKDSGKISRGRELAAMQQTAEENAELTVKPVPKLEAENRVDTVGTVGGLRVYIPARMAKDSQFPFSPGEIVTLRGVSDATGAVIGILMTKKKDSSSGVILRKTGEESSA